MSSDDPTTTSKRAVTSSSVAPGLLNFAEGNPSEPLGFASPYSRYVLFMMFVAVTFSYLDRILVSFLAPLIKKDLQLSDTSLGLLSGTAFAIIYCIANVPVAWLADRFSRKWVIVGGMGLWSAATVAFGLGQRFQHLLFSRVAVGFGETGAVGPAYSILSVYFPDRQRARALAIQGFGQYIGVAAGAVLTATLVASMGWRGAFLIAGLAGLIVTGLIALTVRDAERPAPGIAQANVASLPECLSTMLRKPAYVMLVVGSVLSALAKMPQTYWIPSYFTRSFDLTVAQAALIFGAINLAGGLTGVWLAGYVTDRLAAKSPTAYLYVPSALMLACTVPLAMLFMTTSPIIAFACYFIDIMLAAGALSPVVAGTQFLAGPKMRATSAAICVTATTAVGTGLGVPLVGAISDMFVPAFGEHALQRALLVSLPALTLLSAVVFFVGGRLMRSYDADRQPVVAT